MIFFNKSTENRNIYLQKSEINKFVKINLLNYNFAMQKIQKLLAAVTIVVLVQNITFAQVPVPLPPAKMHVQTQQNKEPSRTTNKPANSQTAATSIIQQQKKNNTHQIKKVESTPKKTKPEKTAQSIKPSELNDLREQAKFLYNTNKLDEAAEIFNKISEPEKISDDWLFLANIAQDKEKPIDAVFYLKKAIALDDNNYKAHYNLGNLYFADNKVNMALNEYRKVLRLKKDYAYAYYNKGCCYLKKKSWFNARYEFGLAIKANPEEPEFYYNLAYTYKMMKKTKKAQEALDMYNKLMTQ